MDRMMKAISKYPNGTYLKIEWGKNEPVIEGKIDTIYESNNGWEEDDVQYREFYACALRIKRINGDFKRSKYAINDLIEISIENQPTCISLYDGSVVWKRD